MLDDTTNPPGWQAQSDIAHEYRCQFYDKVGRVLPEYQEKGIPRTMKLRHIFYSQDSCSAYFRDGRPVNNLVAKLKKDGDPRVLEGNEIHVCLYKGRYWSLDHRRLYAMKQVFNEDTLISVRYFEEPKFLKGGEEFIRKFGKEKDALDGTKIEVRWNSGSNAWTENGGNSWKEGGGNSWKEGGGNSWKEGGGNSWTEMAVSLGEKAAGDRTIGPGAGGNGVASLLLAILSFRLFHSDSVLY